MNKKIALAGLIIIFAISFVALLRLSQNGDVRIETNEPNNTQTNSSASNTSTLLVNSTTPLQIPTPTQTFARHASSADCWILYQNKIYDITSYLPRHPGGINKIAQFCGKPGFEQAFVDQHGTSKVSALMKVGVFIGDFDIKGTIA